MKVKTSPRRSSPLLLALITVGFSYSAATLACSSCGCTLSSDWAAQGYSAHAGFHIDARYDFFNQDQLRRSSSSVSKSSFEIPNDSEVQQKTLNRNFVLTLDYAASADWGVTIQIPRFDRYHQTIAEGDTDVSTSHTDAFGDIRVLTRFQGFSKEHNIGVQLGLKLPSGDIHEKFNGGPLSGEEIDRGLQPGTGTTDALIGIYHFGALVQNWDYFGQALLQQPLNSRESFKPGTGLNANVGLRYIGISGITPHIQINARVEGRESGDNADKDNSGAQLVYLSPGVTATITPALKVYGFYQTPIYQHVNGVQIEPRFSVSFGVQYKI